MATSDLTRGGAGGSNRAVRIPQVDQRSSVSGGAQQPRASFDNSIGSALAGVSRGVSDVIGGVQQNNDLETQLKIQEANIAREKESVVAAAAASESSLSLLQWAQEAKTNAAPGADGFTDLVKAGVDKHISESTAKMSEFQANEYRKHMLYVRERMIVDGIQFQQQEGIRYEGEKITAGIGNSEKLISQAPDLLESELARWHSTIDSSGRLSAAGKAKIKEESRSRLAWAAGVAEVDANPLGFLKKPVGESGYPQGSVFDALLSQESGGKQFDRSGKPITSSAGAIGIAQIMPATAPEAARLAGLPFDENKYRNDAEYNKKLGEAYFNAQLDAFSGDTRKALAAYNAGPGAVNVAVREANRNGGDWLSYLPAETRKYVPAILNRVSQQQPQHAPAEEIPPSAWSKYLTYDEKVKLQNYAEREAAKAETARHQQQAQYRGYITGRVQDAVAMAADGVADPEPMSKVEFQKAYGSEWAQPYDDYVSVQELAVAVGTKIVGQPIGVVQQNLEAYKPKPGPGYAKEERIYNAYIAAVQNDAKQRAADPAAYAARTNPSVTKVLENIGTDPQGYAVAVLAEQQRLGIPNGSLLPKAYATQIGEEISRSGGQKAAEVMEREATRWGKYWPQAHKEMSKVLPPAALVIGMGIPKDAASLLSEIAPLKNEQLVAGLEPTIKKDVADRMSQALDPLRNTLIDQEGGVSTFSTIAGQTERLAYAYVQRGLSPTEAVKTAAQKIAGGYEYFDTYRVPKGVQINSVETGASRLLKDLNNLPIGVPKAPAGVRQEDYRADFIDTLRDKAYWVTSKGDTGLTLYAKEGGVGAYLPDPHGNPISFTWQELGQIKSKSEESLPGAAGQANADLAAIERERQRLIAARRGR